MNTQSRMNPLVLTSNWGWLLFWGILLVALGMVAINVAAVTTLISVVFLGCILVISGLIIIFDSFKTWWRKSHGFFLHLLMGILYLVAGIMLIQDPVFASISLTLFLGIFYIVIGTLRVIYSSALMPPRWGWAFINGLISLLLGILILANWPAASLFIIGLFVGIDLIFLGWAYMMFAFAARANQR